MALALLALVVGRHSHASTTYRYAVIQASLGAVSSVAAALEEIVRGCNRDTASVKEVVATLYGQADEMRK